MSLISRIVFSNYQRQRHCDLSFLRTIYNSSCSGFSKSLGKNQAKSCSAFYHRCALGSHQMKLCFHTSQPKNALPPVVLVLLRPLTKFLAVAFGRSIRVWWKSLPEIQRQSFISSFKRRKFFYVGCLAPIPAGAAYFYISHIDENPITKRKRFIAFSHEQMEQLANIEQEVITEDYQKDILPATHPHYIRVVNVVRRLLNANKDIEGINEHKWHVIIVDKPDIPNAFVLPNGTIFMFTGMLEMCSNDNQLGIVLAHEMSHTILRHTAEQVSNAHLIEFLLFFPVVLIWAILPDVGAVLTQFVSGLIAKMALHLPFSRQTEMEADDVGLTLAAKACFDVREAPCFWKKIKALIKDNEVVEWLSTHPSYETRQVVLDGLMPTALKLRDTCQCPKLPSSDPRLHIDLWIQKMNEEKERQLLQLQHNQIVETKV